MKTYLKYIITPTIIAITAVSCVKDSFTDPVQPNCVSPNVTKTKEILSVYAQATNTTAIYSNKVNGVEVPEYIEAIVNSSDEEGNFYKTMYLQPTDGTRGLAVSVDEDKLYTQNLEPGRKVFIKLNGLAYANPASFARGLILGAAPTDKYAVDRLSKADFKNHIIPSCTVVTEDSFVNKIAIDQTNNDLYLNTLVAIDKVQFESECDTYDPNRDDEFDGSTTITNGTNKLTVRTSRYALFAGHNVPIGNGTIKGILTRYNNGYQLILRNKKDVNFTNPRIDLQEPKIGNAIQYLPTFTENFESYATVNNSFFPKYVNDAATGSRYWEVKSYANNKYIQMSSNNTSCARTILAMPVLFTPGKKLSFKTKDGYNNGAVLKVYYTTNYTPGTDINNVQLVDITNIFTIASGTVTGYATNFTNSGAYTIPTNLSGNGFFIFEYIGTDKITTTMQIDDIIVN